MAAAIGQIGLVDKCIRDVLALQVGWRRLREQDREDVVQTVHLFLCESLGRRLHAKDRGSNPFQLEGHDRTSGGDAWHGPRG